MGYGRNFKYPHYTDKIPPGIDYMKIVDIDSIQQILYVREQNTDTPIILWVHGCLGNSMMPLLYLHQYVRDDDFTVVNWD